ncbi:MAG: hypothetical protein ACOC8E_08260 [Planctomycetota bacterium]
MPTWDEMTRPPTALKREGFQTTIVRLGRDTYNTCNPGIGDVDGDGLDEVAVPIIEDDRCRIALYKGDGSELWRQDDVRFYNDYYGDPAAHAGSHWHPASRHRHLVTHIFDIDGDGRPEVVCADGPVWVLDAATGAVKGEIDLDAHVQVWCPAKLNGRDAPPSFVGGVQMRDGSGSSIVFIGEDLRPDPLVPVEGRSFEDFMWAGDVDRDGFDEIVFSLDSTRSMFLMDRSGQVRWKRKVEGVIGDDTHVDDVVIDPILPGDEPQILMATGPALLDRHGEILWTRGDRYDHAQRVLAVPCPDGDGKDVYFCESYARGAYLLDHGGNEVWRYDDFQRPRPEYENVLRFRLTTAGCLADWFGTGEPVIVQAETAHGRSDELALDGMATCYAFLFSRDGGVIATIPFEDRIDRWGGAMCARRGRFTSPDRDDLVIITHSSSRMYFVRSA